MGLEGPTWVAFTVSPPLHPAVSSPFSAAPTVQPKAALGLWRRWLGKAEVPHLLQHHPVEQAGGLGRLSFPQGAGHRAALPGTCDRWWHWQVCLLGRGGVRARAAPGWGTHGVLQPYMFFRLCLCLLACLERGGCGLGQAVFSSRSFLVGKGSQVPTPGERPCSPSGTYLAQLSPMPCDSLPMIFISAATTVTSPLPCYFFVAFKCISSRPHWLVPEPGPCAHPWLHVCVWVMPAAGVRGEGAFCSSPPSPQAAEKNKPLIIACRSSILLFLSWTREACADRGRAPNLSQTFVGAPGWCHPLVISTLQPEPRRWHRVPDHLPLCPACLMASWICMAMCLQLRAGKMHRVPVFSSSLGCCRRYPFCLQPPRPGCSFLLAGQQPRCPPCCALSRVIPGRANSEGLKG